jgi:hypothetical protein
MQSAHLDVRVPWVRESNWLRERGYGDWIPVETKFTAPFQTALGLNGRGVAPRLKKVYSYTFNPPLDLHDLLYGELWPLNFAFNLTLQVDSSGNKMICRIKMADHC